MKLSPKRIILLLFVFFTPMFLASWAGGQWRQIEGLSLSKSDGKSGSYLLLDNSLLHYDGQGILLQQLLLDPFAKSHIGDFAFFSNGDVLLVPETQTLTFVDEILIFLRLSGELHKKLITKQGQLTRCRFIKQSCRSLENFSLSFSGAFSLAISDNDQIIVSDTSRHEIYLLDETGLELDKISTGLRFPNSIQLYENSLYIANTNKHQINKVAIFDKQFAKGEQWQIWPMDQPVQLEHGHTWPTDLVVDEQGIWVLAQDNNLSYGSIYQFSHQGELLKTIAAPENSDLVSIAAMGQQLIAVDYASMQVYRYTAGELMGLLKSEVQAQRVKQLKNQQAPFKWLEKVAWLAFIVFFILGLLVAIWFEIKAKNRQKQQAKARASCFPDREQPDIDDPAIVWLSASKQIKRQFMLLIWGLAISSVLFVFGFVILSINGETSHFFSIGPVLLAATPIAVISFKKVKQNLSNKIGFLDGWLFIKTADKQQAIGFGQEVYYHQNVIGIDKLMVTTNSGRKGLYNPELLEQYLAPVLVNAQKVTGWHIAKLKLETTPKRELMVMVLAIISLLGALVFVEWQGA